MKAVFGMTLAMLALVAAPVAAQTGAPQVNKPASDSKPAAAKSDSMAEKGDEKQKKLQQHQDRHAKAANTLSNTMKKQAETQSTVTGNLK
jgi:hypothetical protein